MVQDAEMTAQTACDEWRGPGAAWQHLRCPFAVPWGPVLWGPSPGLSWDAHRSSLLLKAHSSRTPETTELGDHAPGGWFWLPSGAALAPLPRCFGAVPGRRERSWCARKRPHFCSDLTQFGTWPHGRLRWHDWCRLRMQDLNASHARLAASLTMLALAPHSLPSP